MEDLSKMSKEQIIEKARAAKKAEEWEKVEKLQLELLRRNPNDVDAISSLVVVAKKLKNWEYLIKLQEMRLNIDPQNIPSMADLANVAAKQNNWQEAEKMERRILEINPQDKKAKRQLKYILKKQREIDCVGIYRKELKTENMNITKANEAIANLKQKGGIRENLLIAEIQARVLQMPSLALKTLQEGRKTAEEKDQKTYNKAIEIIRGAKKNSYSKLAEITESEER